jgi:hypothetical protein
MTRDRTPKPVANDSTNSPRELEEQIRCRAYELYEKRGRQDGQEQDDWFRAEAEISGTATETAAAEASATKAAA